MAPKRIRRSLALPASWRFLLLALLIAVSAEGAPRPNFVFIMSDDHAYQAVSAYGAGINNTPNIDRIAREGIRFDRAYVPNSLCGPCRATVLTGKHSSRNGFYDNRSTFDGTQWTMAKSLQRAGYQTAIVGKWHLVSEPTGFDHWDVLPGQGKYYRPDFITPAGKSAIDGYVTDVTTDKAIAWLNGAGETGRKADKPFLLMIHQKAPHRPWDPAPERLKEFVGREIPEPATLLDDYSTRTSSAVDAKMRIGETMNDRDIKTWAEDNNHRQWLYNHMTADQKAAWVEHIDPRQAELEDSGLEGDERTRWKWRRYMEDYLACVASVDEGVGRVLDWLDGAGLAENTVVVYMSDQGFYLGEHGWFDKRFMYEESLRTPMVVRWPAGLKEPGREEGRIVSNLDIAPTFLELAGAEVDPEVDGRSLTAILRSEPTPDWREDFYYHYHEGPERDHNVQLHDGVTDGRHKLIHFYKRDEWELYDLEEDPRELSNVADDPRYAEVRERLTARLAELREDYGFTPPKVGE
ncbi:sulfatase family protein [Botrimarina mediterranea]|uniref:Arylsulfatase n=1 Tax=Botrimarina mediterranea TaxID=2528022 RepID=A0A518K998_9BACT|nr:sulfatase [Botrimarina mediterranea]QDV74366.1 Arylsulfatase [Botrimarina mediterranea]